MLTPLDDALAHVHAAFSALPAEVVPLTDALGCVLAVPAVARREHPGFDASAMDGFAIRHADVATASVDTPVALRVVGESRAGSPATDELAAGECVRVFTGGVVPPSADAVVMQEDVDLREGVAHVKLAVPKGHHVRFRAEDVALGDELLPAGTQVHAGTIALLAGQGFAQVTVHRRPRVAILVTGDELREIGETTGEGILLDSNGPTLDALCRELGAVPVRLPRAPDDPEALRALVEQGLAEADVLVTTGGASVGDHDHVQTALAAAGVEVSLWKVAVKPGKPVIFGRRGDGKSVLGLPGNPASVFVSFHLFVAPALRKMAGTSGSYSPLLPVSLADAHRHSPGRTEMVRATLVLGDDGWMAHIAPRQGSGGLTSLGKCDCLVILPKGRAEFDAGDALLALPLRLPGLASSPMTGPAITAG